jgi:VWFA-related protein
MVTFCRYVRGLYRAIGLSIAAVSLFLCAQGICAQVEPTKEDPTEVLRVDAKLVDLKVSVVFPGPAAAIPALKRSDFAVSEDGKPQAVQFFSAADAPFDLILLLDLSGSSADKIKLIRKSAERFINAARPADRVAVLTFTSDLILIAPLNSDREKLKQDLKNIDGGNGGTNFWDSLRYVLTHLPSERITGRRSAVVIMTDGYDNALPGGNGAGGSVTTFPQLMEFVRKSPAIMLPIYLDTEKEMLKKKNFRLLASSYATARDQLKQIATDGGGSLYYARRIEDLKGVYDQVIRDLGTVYSIGYEPERELDGSWRQVAVTIPGHPELMVRTRPGYYAKVEGPGGQ